ncbi:MAG: calcium-translocating P-type ATPase, PMCA-type [Christensenellaceae bacterium]|nr:calcium-translocating P-type ATPase, PMCA-type [Christensenellaceae bacterium]
MKPVYTLTVDETLNEYKTAKTGLTSQEASKRLSEYGRNQLKEEEKTSLIVKFFKQFKDMMVIVLLLAALVSAVLAIVEKQYQDLVEGALILLIVIINAIIGVVQESKAEASMEALKNLNKPFAKVLRDNLAMKIKSEEIVPGDVVILEAGDVVPADIRLFECASLKVEEAALTGESVPSEKGIDVLENPEAPLGDRFNMCYGTGIIHFGRGAGVAVATGMNTEVGKIADMLNEKDESQTPLQIQLAKTAKTLSLLVLVIAAIIFIVAFVRGLTSDANFSDVFGLAFMTAIAIAVAAIPEGLPAVVTIVLAIGVRRMSEKNAIVRNLPAVETLGCCEVICSDKTGTLTLNKMTVKEIYTKGVGNLLAGDETLTSDVIVLLRCIALCNDTRRENDKLQGDPTETALIAYTDGLNYDFSAYERVDEIPFDSIRKLMSTINMVDGRRVAHIKGAPDLLLDKCSVILVGDTIRAITDDDKNAIIKANADMASKALRILGAAIKYENLDKENTEKDMIFVGLVGMIDPPRAEVKDAVKKCRRAGMKPIMITGDHAATAKAIALDIGILTKNGIIMTGAELDKLDDDEMAKNLDNYCVFARVSPENKVRIVKAYQAKGKKVAMTGDGVNDAPGIKAADIGIGMGITGTDVSKGASDVVLADDNFATIITAIEEGRKVYGNIKKAIQYLLSANIAEVLCLFIATLFLNVSFLTPVMILWINLVTDSLPALALGMEKADRDVMNQPPRKTGEGLLSGKTGKAILIQGIMQTVLVMLSFCIGKYVLFPDTDIAMTMAFITLCFIQLFHSFNMRFPDRSLFSENPFGNKPLNISFLICASLLILVLLIPGVGTTMFGAVGAEELGVKGWSIALATALGILPFAEIQKAIGLVISRKKKNVAISVEE